MAGKSKKRRKKNEPAAPPRPKNPLSTKIQSVMTRFPPVVVALFIIGILFLVQGIFFVSSFQTNDDIGMLFIASGNGSSIEPDEHLRYTHVFIGFVLKYLYSQTQAIPWYGLYQYFLHFISMVALAYAVIDKDGSARRLLFLLLYLFFVELFLLNNMQYTITACIAAQSGVFLFFNGLSKDTRGRWVSYAAAIFLLIASALVRTNGFFLMMLISLPILSISVWRNRNDRGMIRDFIGFWFIVSIAVFGLRTFERQYYRSDPAWAEFFTFSKLKSRFIDYDHIEYNEETKHIFDDAGWSRNDLFLMRSWFHADEDLFSVDKLESISSQFPSFKTYLSIGEVFGTVTDKILDQWFMVLLAVFFMLYLRGGEKGNRAYILATLALIFAVFLYLLVARQLPNRVIQPVLSFLLVAAMYFSSRELEQFSPVRKIVNTAMIGGICIALLFFLSEQHRESADKIAANRQFKNTVGELDPSPDDLYVIWGSVPWESILPFDTLDFMRDWKLVLLGTTLRTPITKARLAEFGIDNIYRALYERPNVFIVTRNRRYLYFYSQYVLEHFGENLQFQYVFRSPEFYVTQVYPDADSQEEDPPDDIYLNDPYN